MRVYMDTSNDSMRVLTYVRNVPIIYRWPSLDQLILIDITATVVPKYNWAIYLVKVVMIIIIIIIILYKDRYRSSVLPIIIRW
jgi:hypothetical protein